jgi:3-deoxy-D-manno-octulosonic-acid transferase
VVAQLSEAGGYKKIANADELSEVVSELLIDAAGREQMGSSARAVIMNNVGATQRTLALLSGQLEA